MSLTQAIDAAPSRWRTVRVPDGLPGGYPPYCPEKHEWLGGQAVAGFRKETVVQRFPPAMVHIARMRNIADGVFEVTVGRPVRRRSKVISLLSQIPVRSAAFRRFAANIICMGDQIRRPDTVQ
jgi:hypothetical protein